MGGSKSNTGIKVLDDAVDSVVNDGTNKLASGVSRDAQALGKNLEKGTQRQLAGWGQIFGGKWNNIGHTLIAGPMDISGMNADDVDRAAGGYGSNTAESAQARYTREANEKTASDEVAADQAATTAKATEATRAFSAQIEGMATATKRSTGRSQTLIGNKASTNTLLTLKGK